MNQSFNLIRLKDIIFLLHITKSEIYSPFFQGNIYDADYNMGTWSYANVDDYGLDFDFDKGKET